VQCEHPPSANPKIGDYGRYHYSLLEPRLPADIRALVAENRLAIGEVGVMSPNAFSTFVPPAGYTIQFYTGMMRFLYRVSRAMHTRVRVFEADGRVHEPTVDFAPAVTIMAEIFRNFMQTKRIAGPQNYPIVQAQIETASGLATCAETFVLAHEIGHIAIWHRRGRGPRRLSRREEIQADRLALTFVLGVEGQPGALQNISPRMAYAGAEFMLRVFSGLGHLGYKFMSTHPPPSHRLKKIRELATELCGGRRGFIKLSTIALSYDQLLEAVERNLAGSQAAKRFVVGVSPERVLSTLAVLIEQCVRKQLTLDFAVQEATVLLTEAPGAVARQAAREAAHMYTVEPIPPGSADEILFAQQEIDTFLELTKRLLAPWNQVFAEAIANPHGGIWSLLRRIAGRCKIALGIPLHRLASRR
jgi:hypothetical protein